MAASKDSYTYYNGNGYSNDNSKDIASGGLADISFRFFFLKGQSVMSGLYAGPYGRYSKNTFEIHTYNLNVIGAPTSFKYNIESYEGGALFGWQWIIKNAFVMDMYVGGGLKISNNNAPNYYNTNDPTFYILESQDYTGITPKAGFRLGFVF
jgi:hypothetical protein